MAPAIANADIDPATHSGLQPLAAPNLSWKKKMAVLVKPRIKTTGLIIQNFRCLTSCQIVIEFWRLFYFALVLRRCGFFSQSTGVIASLSEQQTAR